jgi:hypothetical protein
VSTAGETIASRESVTALPITQPATSTGRRTDETFVRSVMFLLALVGIAPTSANSMHP